MSRFYFNRWSQNRIRNRQKARSSRKSRTLNFEQLSERVVLSVSASFAAATGVLSVIGDQADNNIVLSRDVAGNILVNGGAISIAGGRPTVANTALIQVLGQGGNDQISLDEANGVLPSARLSGGTGNDTLTGGSANDMLFGDAGNDILLGKGGADQLFGGDGNDTLTGGAGNDSVFGQSGNDRMIWNPGDGTDLNEGGTGVDTVEVEGGNGSETFTIAPNGSRVRFDRTTPGPFSIDIGTSENLVLNANGGDDQITASSGLANLIHLTLDGGDGNDTITGGDGNDMIIGGKGSDTMNGGAGNDTFVWNPGDGSDIVEGQSGRDTLQFNGAAVKESIALSNNGGRLQLVRDVGTVTMDVAGVEQVNIAALAGPDTITVNDLARTGVTDVNIDLAGTAGSHIGDGEADTVIVNGTAGRDAIGVAGRAGTVDVFGLAAGVHIVGAEAANDRLIVNALDGNDFIDASRLRADAIGFTADGGEGNDIVVGGAGNDTLLGGNGNDLLFGGPGQDSLDGSAGVNVVRQ